MNCPMCNIALNMMDRQGVEIDYCPKCRGIWLDRGELEKLIELSIASTRPSVQSVSRVDERREIEEKHPDRTSYDHDQSRSRKKESWLSRLMDFD